MSAHPKRSTARRNYGRSKTLLFPDGGTPDLRREPAESALPPCFTQRSLPASGAVSCWDSTEATSSPARRRTARSSTPFASGSSSSTTLASITRTHPRVIQASGSCLSARNSRPSYGLISPSCGKLRRKPGVEGLTPAVPQLHWRTHSATEPVQGTRYHSGGHQQGPKTERPEGAQGHTAGTPWPLRDLRDPDTAPARPIFTEAGHAVASHPDAALMHCNRVVQEDLAGATFDPFTRQKLSTTLSTDLEPDTVTTGQQQAGEVADKPAQDSNRKVTPKQPESTAANS